MEIEEAVRYLCEQSGNVGRARDRGNAMAARVIDLYELARTCPGDVAARTFLCCALEDYIRDRQSQEWPAAPFIRDPETDELVAIQRKDTP
jgi:hypothetical protein